MLLNPFLLKFYWKERMVRINSFILHDFELDFKRDT